MSFGQFLKELVKTRKSATRNTASICYPPPAPETEIMTEKLSLTDRASAASSTYKFQFNFQVQDQVPDDFKVIYSNSGVRRIRRPLFNDPSGWHRRNFVQVCSTGKTRIIGLPYAEESLTISSFDIIPERDRQTDRQAETERIARPILISRVSTAIKTTVASRGKKNKPIIKIEPSLHRYNQLWLEKSTKLVLAPPRRPALAPDVATRCDEQQN